MVQATHSLEVRRLIHAPREKVFAAFLDAEAMRKWFGPDGFDTVTHEMDPRVGGIWLFTMHGPDGTDYPNWVKYLEIVPPERIQWDQGQTIGEAAWHRTTVTFEEAGEATDLTLHLQLPDADALRRAVDEVGAGEGGKQTLARLAAYVETEE
jgi:uncharacterized protein YndB with AHSA1/START domain